MTMTPDVFDDRVCQLGEGPVWHPLRSELFWTDIERDLILSRGERQGQGEYRLACKPSALGWVDENRLFVGTDAGLGVFDLRDEALAMVCPLEADQPERRSNDGRSDPWGGFWISTMTHAMEPGLGRIYRWYQGELRQLIDGLACPNAICFSPDRSVGYFADSMPGKIFCHDLDPETGWPTSEARVFTQGHKGAPDGAVTALDGTVWNAEWGQGRLLAFAPQTGALIQHFDLPARQLTCPAIDPDTGRVFVTSAAVGLEDATAADGQTFVLDLAVSAAPEPAVAL
ncbi:MAG: SMP-30/gluconolactonase/LRE family protein [Alphaproteobacteria bacterium]